MALNLKFIYADELLVTSRRKKKLACKGEISAKSKTAVKRIKDAVARFLRVGEVSSVTPNAVSKSSGVGIGTLLHHFPDRNSLIAGVYEDQIIAQLELAEKALKENPSEELGRVFEKFIEKSIDFFQKDPELYEKVAQLLPESQKKATMLKFTEDATDKIEFLLSNLNEISDIETQKRLLYV